MTRPLIDAQIEEIDDGPYYTVRLHAIPRVGETIALKQFTSRGENDHSFTVVEVRHMIYDTGAPSGGAHSISVMVAPATPAKSDGQRVD